MTHQMLNESPQVRIKRPHSQRCWQVRSDQTDAAILSLLKVTRCQFLLFLHKSFYHMTLVLPTPIFFLKN